MDETTLILLTHNFPFGKGENFLESEINFMNFRNIICISMVGVGIPKVVGKDGIMTILSAGGIMKPIKDLKWILASFLSLEFWKELMLLIKNTGLDLSALRDLLVMTAYGERMISVLSKKLNSHPDLLGKKVILYSYWLTSTAYCSIKMKNHIKKPSVAVSRAHGHDLYSERRKNNYLPYRKLFITSLDTIYCVSQNGKEYLENMYYIEKSCDIKVSRLGTNDYGFQKTDSCQDYFTIVSCSDLIKIKRVHRVIEVLSKIQDKKILWIHIGDGLLSTEIQELASHRLQQLLNIQFQFMGRMENKRVMEFYSNTFVNVFLNVSESEGIPVSIMEALSFGIPVIATNVGGVNEIVKDSENGYLLKKDYKTDELEVLIRQYIDMPSSVYLLQREQARQVWNEQYNSQVNFTDFYKQICEMVEHVG